MQCNSKYSLDNIEGDSSLDFLSVLNNSDPDFENNFKFSDSPYDNVSLTCQYTDESEYSLKFSSCTDLIICSINIQSLSAKFSDLSQMINYMNRSKSSPDIICLQELWRFPDEALFKLEGYHPLVYKLRHNNVQGGGIGIYIKLKFSFSILNESSIFVDRIFESLAIEVTINSRKVIIGSMYRPGTKHPTLTFDENYKEFLELFSNFCSNLIPLGSVYLLGDINLDFLKYKKCEKVTNFVDLLFSFGLLQILTKPTRCTPSSATLIDVILTNEINSDLNSTILVSHLSDHFPVFHTVKSISSSVSPKFVESRNFSKHNITVFNDALLRFNWSTVINCKDTQQSYNNFSDSFLALYDLHFPISRFKFNKNYSRIEKWMSKGILTSRREKIRLSKLCFSHPTPLNTIVFKKYRNMYNKIVKVAKKMSYDRLFKKFQSNLSKTWQLIHEVINKKPKKESNTFSHLLINNCKVSDPFTIANEFNEFFTSIAQKIAEEILPTDKPPDLFPSSPDDICFNLKSEPLTHSEVFEAINSIQKKKTLDIYGLSVSFISKFALTLSKPLRHIFSLSFSQGVVPQQLKIAKVIPIFKSGSRNSMDNYRPISLLCVFSKILEKIMFNRLSSFLETNNIICPEQFGFRKSHSTTHPLTLFINQIAEHLNKKEHSIAIFCDLKKAFDTVDFKILLTKLHNIGVRGTELLWFQDYLCNRKQFVSINGTNSYLLQILFGVPQGSILGPILFLIYINDLPKCTSLSSSLFADDTKLTASGPDLMPLMKYVNDEFQKVLYFFRSHKLSLHPAKTKFILFSNSKPPNELKIEIFINNNNFNSEDPKLISPIEQITASSDVPAIKFLGVYIDPLLNFKFHISQLNTKISKALFFLRNSKNLLSVKGLLALYYSLIHCHLVYANLIWSSTKENNYKSLFLKQKTAIRIVSSASYNAHTEPLFKQAKILPLPKLCLFFKLQFFFQFTQGFLPAALRNMWIRNRDRNPDHLYRLRNENEIFTFTSRLSHFENFPLYSIPSLWSSFTNENVKIQRNKNDFNILLKKHLLDELNESFTCSRLLCPQCHLNIN